MRTVTAAVDGSAASDAVLDAAVSIGTIYHAPVQAFHVSDELDAAAAAAAERHRIPMTLIVGDPEDEVIRHFEAENVCVAVIGCCGRRGGPVPAGHLACRAMQSLRVPLLVVPPVVARPLTSPGPAVVPLDGTRESADAVRPVLDLLRAADVEIVVLHSFHGRTVPTFWDRPAHDTEDWGREFHRRFIDLHIDASVDLARGEPGAQILRVAGEHDAALLVLGWACDLSAGHAETIRRVLVDATVPVMLLPTARA